MNITGNLRKMQTTHSTPVQYGLRLNEAITTLNDAIGQAITLHYTGNIHCVACGRKTKKSFNQGYCYPCFKRLAECDTCIIKPELCHYAEGTCRQPEWGEAHCLQPHYVYLANSSGLKVGITRHTQIPTRWMDQGAVAALPIIQVATRKLSGLVEVAAKNHVADKTHWQKMLKGEVINIDLKQARGTLLGQIQPTLDALRAEHGHDAIQVLDTDVQYFDYPVLTYPTKVKSLNFDKTPEVSGVLQGIKGQYLILDTGVINLRKFGGYEVEVILADA